VSNYYKVKCKCGGNPKMSDPDELRFVYCDRCGMGSLPWSNTLQAVLNWNAMQKRLRRIEK
jgi:hypothetical protein